MPYVLNENIFFKLICHPSTEILAAQTLEPLAFYSSDFIDGAASHVVLPTFIPRCERNADSDGHA